MWWRRGLTFQDHKDLCSAPGFAGVWLSRSHCFLSSKQEERCSRNAGLRWCWADSVGWLHCRPGPAARKCSPPLPLLFLSSFSDFSLHSLPPSWVPFLPFARGTFPFYLVLYLKNSVALKGRGWPTFFVQGQRVNILRSVGHTRSVATTQLHCLNT